MLKVEGLAKRFGGSDAQGFVLRNIDLAVAKGEFLCLLGASGCGKTTLLNILAGFEPASAGRVMLDGRALRPGVHDCVLLFQDAGSALFPWLTAAENVQFGLRLRGMPRTERVRVADRYLAKVGLAGHGGKFPAEMSGGMRQRLQIARALAVEPSILLMDEPFAALDALTRRRMHAELLRIWQDTGTTIVFVTHDIAESIILADRVAVMTPGPAAAMREIIAVDMPRPRDPADRAFGLLFRRIEVLLGEESFLEPSGRAASLLRPAPPAP